MRTTNLHNSHTLRLMSLLTAFAILALCLLCPCGTDKALAESTEKPVIAIAIKDVSQRGNVVLDITCGGIQANGMDVGDLISVYVGDTEYVLPIGTSYTDVDSGAMICRFDLANDNVILAVNMGSFANETGMISDTAADNEQSGIVIDEIGLSLKEKFGYIDEYNIRQLTRTNEREDYPELTDAEFANFRAVSVGGLKENVLYRGSSPIDPSLGRDAYAMAAMENAGVRSVVNLDDSVETMQGRDAYPGSYYSTCQIINPEMGYDFMSEEFGENVKTSIQFIIQNDGPYLLHCKEGKDRTGILCAILECYVGATAEDVITDYMITYSNFYHVYPNNAAYDVIVQSNLVKTLCALYQVDDLETADLQAEAAEYLRSVGLADEELEALSAKLAA